MTIGNGGAVWTTTGWSVTPKSSTTVMEILGRIGAYSRGQRFAWRGMSSVDFVVESALHRELGAHSQELDLRAAEVKILHAAREWGLGLTESAHVDDLQLLADLQHYGAPTRLIDFTSNPMTALWFACQDAPDRDRRTERRLAKSGVILALNVTKWRNFRTVGAPYGTTWGGLKSGAGFALEQALQEPEPFVVQQSIPNPRLRAQEGFFVAGAAPDMSSLRKSLLTPFHSLNVPFEHGDSEDLEMRLTKDRTSGFPELFHSWR